MAPTLEQRLNSYVRSLQEQGILDISFNQLRTLSDDENPRFLIDLIATFCEDGEKTISEMTKAMATTPVNYKRLGDAIIKFEGSSLCIGGRQVPDTCRDLRHACEHRNRERCSANLQLLLERFNVLHDRLNRVAQFETTILNERGKI